jgi:hypothetical protein
VPDNDHTCSLPKFNNGDEQRTLYSRMQLIIISISASAYRDENGKEIRSALDWNGGLGSDV